MPDFTRKRSICNNSVAVLTAVGPANRSAVPAQAWVESGAEQLVARFVGSGIAADVTVSSHVGETASARPAALTREEHSYTAAWRVDPHLIAAMLARADSVDAVYVSDSQGRTHVWTVLRDYCDAGLDAVFERELELHDCFGRRLASVEFHVSAQDTLHNLDIGDRIFQRVRH